MFGFVTSISDHHWPCWTLDPFRQPFLSPSTVEVGEVVPEIPTLEFGLKDLVYVDTLWLLNLIKKYTYILLYCCLTSKFEQWSAASHVCNK